MGCCDYVYETRDKVTHSDPLKTVRDVSSVSYDLYKHNVDIANDLLHDNRGALAAAGIGMVFGGSSFAFTLMGEAGVNKDLANETFDVMTGKYADEQKDIQEASDNYDNKVTEYENAMDAISDKYVIDDEIFQLAAANEAKRTQDKYIDEIEALRSELNKMIKDFKQEFKNFQNLLDDKYLKYFAWMPLVAGGFISDVKGFIEDGDYEAGRRALNVVGQVIGIIISIVITVVTWGSTAWVTVPLIISAISQLIALAINLDSMYGQGLLMNGAFSILDYALNEVLHLDDVWSELGTEKLSDTKYYEELTGYVSMINAIVGMIASLVAGYNMPSNPGVATSATSSISTAYPIVGEIASITSSMSYRVLSTMYNAYKLYDDSRRAEEALEALKEKSKNDIDKINKKLERNKRRKMMESYRAEEQILTGTSNIVSEYAMSAFASPTASFDPEMTIAANYGYEYSGDNVMDFIPEFTTDYNSLAGGSKYTNKILYKI